MNCKKCGSSFGTWTIIEGKKKNLSSRKYCLNCSPYMGHNTKNFEKKRSENKRLCVGCNKEIIRKNNKGNFCWVCTNKKQFSKRLALVQDIVGIGCWICGYNNCWNALDFHHIDPKEKLFNLTSREFQYKWDRIFLEIKKCVLICSCCHREVHAGLIENSFILDLWKNKWVEILENKDELIKNSEEILFEKKPLFSKICKECKATFETKYKDQVFCSNDCRVKNSRIVDRPSKDELVKLIWEKPFIQIAKDFGVSDKAVAKWCKKYQIEKPPIGYWAKKNSLDPL